MGGEKTILLLAAQKYCEPGSWTNTYSSNPADCMTTVLGRSECSDDYFVHAEGDGNCWCVSTGTDCSSNMADWINADPVNLYRIVDVTNEPTTASPTAEFVQSSEPTSNEGSTG